MKYGLNEEFFGFKKQKKISSIEKQTYPIIYRYQTDGYIVNKESHILILTLIKILKKLDDDGLCDIKIPGTNIDINSIISEYMLFSFSFMLSESMEIFGSDASSIFNYLDFFVYVCNDKKYMPKTDIDIKEWRENVKLVATIRLSLELQIALNCHFKYGKYDKKTHEYSNIQYVDLG